MITSLFLYIDFKSCSCEPVLKYLNTILKIRSKSLHWRFQAITLGLITIQGTLRGREMAQATSLILKLVVKSSAPKPEPPEPNSPKRITPESHPSDKHHTRHQISHKPQLLLSKRRTHSGEVDRTAAKYQASGKATNCVFNTPPRNSRAWVKEPSQHSI